MSKKIKTVCKRMSEYLLKFIEKRNNKVKIQDQELHEFDNLKDLLRWIKKDLSVSFYEILEKSRNKQNTKMTLLINETSKKREYIEITKVQTNIFNEIRDLKNHGVHELMIFEQLRHKVKDDNLLIKLLRNLNTNGILDKKVNGV